MKASEISVGHIYYVNFEPTRRGEFGKNHLGVVLRKNDDKITFITIPLTSDSEDRHNSKMPLGIIETLPSHLKSVESFAVLDQVRTLNASRFARLRENDEIVDAFLDNITLERIYEAIVELVLSGAPLEAQARIAETIAYETSKRLKIDG